MRAGWMNSFGWFCGSPWACRAISANIQLEGEKFELLAQENRQAVGGLVAVCTGVPKLSSGIWPSLLSFQGRGIGRSLVTELYRIAKARNCRRIHTIARNTSGDFFRTLGFQTAPGQAPEHPFFLEHGITFELMEGFVEQGAPADRSTATRSRGG